MKRSLRSKHRSYDNTLLKMKLLEQNDLMRHGKGGAKPRKEAPENIIDQKKRANNKIKALKSSELNGKGPELQDILENSEFIGNPLELVTETKKLKPDLREKRVLKASRKRSVRRAPLRLHPLKGKEILTSIIRPNADSEGGSSLVESLIKNPLSINPKAGEARAAGRKKTFRPERASRSSRKQNNRSLHQRRKPPNGTQAPEETISKTQIGKNPESVKLHGLNRKRESSDENSSSTSEIQEEARNPRDDSSNYDPDCEILKGIRSRSISRKRFQYQSVLKKQPSEFRSKGGSFSGPSHKRKLSMVQLPTYCYCFIREKQRRSTATQTKEMGNILQQKYYLEKNLSSNLENQTEAAWIEARTQSVERVSKGHSTIQSGDSGSERGKEKKQEKSAKNVDEVEEMAVEVIPEEDKSLEEDMSKSNNFNSGAIQPSELITVKSNPLPHHIPPTPDIRIHGNESLRSGMAHLSLLEADSLIAKPEESSFKNESSSKYSSRHHLNTAKEPINHSDNSNSMSTLQPFRPKNMEPLLTKLDDSGSGRLETPEEPPLASNKRPEEEVEEKVAKVKREPEDDRDSSSSSMISKPPDSDSSSIQVYYYYNDEGQEDEEGGRCSKYEEKLQADSNDKIAKNYVQGFRRHQEERRFCEDSKGSNKFY